jgi:hypothetical protein
MVLELESMQSDSIVKTLVLPVISQKAFALNQVRTQHNIHDGDFPGVPKEESTVVAHGQLFQRTYHHIVDYSLNIETFCMDQENNINSSICIFRAGAVKEDFPL